MRVAISQMVRDWALRHSPAYLVDYGTPAAAITWLVCVWGAAKGLGRLESIRHSPRDLTLSSGLLVAVVAMLDDVVPAGTGADVTIAVAPDPDGLSWVDLAGWAGPTDWAYLGYGDPPVLAACDLRPLNQLPGAIMAPPRPALPAVPALVIPERRPVDPHGPCPDCGRPLIEGKCWGKCFHGWCRACGASTGSLLRSICMPCATVPDAVSPEIWAEIDRLSGWPWHSGAVIERPPVHLRGGNASVMRGRNV